MRWLGLILGAGALATLQTSIAPKVSLWGTSPDWILIAVVFAALHAPGAWAVVIGWSLGFTADLLTVDTMGLLALSYGCAAWTVSAIRDHVFAQRAITLGVLTLVISGILRIIWLLLLHIRFDAPSLNASSLIKDAIIPAIYTGMWGLILHIPARVVWNGLQSRNGVGWLRRSRGRSDV